MQRAIQTQGVSIAYSILVWLFLLAFWSRLACPQCVNTFFARATVNEIDESKSHSPSADNSICMRQHFKCRIGKTPCGLFCLNCQNNNLGRYCMNRMSRCIYSLSCAHCLQYPHHSASRLIDLGERLVLLHYCTKHPPLF